MNRLATLFLMGLAGLLASCGSSTSSSTQPGTNDAYSVAVSPDQFTLNAGDWSSIAATVDLSHLNSAPKPVAPQPTIKFFSSDPRVTVSPAGEVCAGQWDTKYLTCTPTVKAGALDLPTGQVTITAFNASHNVSGTTLVTVHPRASSITLSAAVGDNAALFQYPAAGCVAQNSQVRYSATPAFVGGATGGTVLDNNYTWVVADPNVASVSSHGFVIARNPGVTSVSAQLNGTGSQPLAFATCPPSSIVIAASTFFTNGTPKGPFTTSDLDSSPPNTPACIAAGTCVLNKGDQKFLTATLFDTLNKPLLDSNNVPLTVPLTFVTSDPLTGSVSPVLPLSSKLSTNTSGRFSVVASCEPPTCNASVADFVSPAGHFTGKDIGFGFPIYSNVIGVTVQGTTASTVLVTNSADSANVKTPVHRLFAYDSESLTVTQTVALQNLPNSLVIAPNGAKAYLGSSDGGLMVVDLTAFQSSVQSFPIAGGISTDLITGKVLGVSPDSRFVLVSDTTKGLVFLIDTTGTKVAARYTIPNINAVTFAADGSNTWIAADPPLSAPNAYSGVYVFNSDTFVPTLTNTSTHVKALAWVPDGQSYFASGDQVINYSTCDDRLNTPSPLAGSPINLAATVLGGVPHVVGLSGSQWFDYPVTTTAQVGGQTATLISGLKPSGTGSGNVCKSTVTVMAPVPVPPVPDPAAATLACANQVIFSQTREAEFVTGVNPSCTAAESVIHGYDVSGKQEITLTTASSFVPLSGGVLNDGRKLYVGSYDGTNAQLHRINLTTDPTTGLTTGSEDVVPDPTNPIPASVGLVPSFVAVVPK